MHVLVQRVEDIATEHGEADNTGSARGKHAPIFLDDLSPYNFKDRQAADPALQDDFDSSYDPFCLTDEVAESVNASVDEFCGIVPPVEISIIGTCNLIDIGI